MYTTFRKALAGLLLACTVLLGGCFDDGDDAAPQFTQQPANVTVAEGARATFTVAIDGNVPLQWFRNGLPIAGATGPTYTTPPATATDDGANFYAATTGSPSVGSQSARLTVLPAAPTITTQPASVTAAAGSAATFTVVATGASPTYQWQRGTTDIAGATAASYTIPAVATGDNGATFRVVVTTRGGSVTSNAATLTVTAPVVAPAITTQPANAGVTVGTPATFSVVATGTSPTYQWQRGTTNIAGATSASYTTPATTLADNGATFRVVVTNSAGSVTSTAATLTVTNPTPPATTRAVPAVADMRDGGIALRADATVWGWGLNDVGQVGDGTTTPRSSPVQVQTASGPLTNVVRISAGPTHALALASDGTVWVWGAGSGTFTAPLGIGSDRTPIARQVLTAAGGAPLGDVVDVAAGRGISAAVRSDGTVVTWGSNSQGQIGGGSFSPSLRDYPFAVPGLAGVVQVSAGNQNVFARSADGRIFAWGFNQNSSLGTGSTDGATTSPAQVTFITTAARVDASGNASFAILSDGTARVWGERYYQADFASAPSSAFCSFFPTNSSVGIQTPPGATGSTYAAVAPHARGALLLFNGRVYQSGDLLDDAVQACSPGLAPMTFATNVAGVSRSWGEFAHAWTADGRVFGFGVNGNGELGVGNTTAGTGAREITGFNLLGAAPSGTTPVLSVDFESAPPAQVTAGSATRVDGQGYVGLGATGNQFGGNLLRSATGNVVTVTLTNLPAHSSINLAFLFAAIDSLDGSGSFPAGDFFRITLDGVTIFRESFANALPSQIQTYLPPPGVELARRVDLGFAGPGGFFTDSAYDFAGDPRFQQIPHTGSTATFTFQIEGGGIQDINDESWGMDNLRISVNP
jgi:alpha-tubulin suppressor-like RCC1 family protein